MFIITKASLVSTLTLIIGIILGRFGILDEKYVNIIVDANIIVQSILLVIFTILLIHFRNRPKGVKILRYQFENKLIKGDTDILSKPISSTNPRKFAIFKIYLEVKEFTEPPEFGIIKTCGHGKSISDIKKHLLNINSCIIEDTFIFYADVIVMPEEKVNFKFKKDTNVKSFLLSELYMP